MSADLPVGRLRASGRNAKARQGNSGNRSQGTRTPKASTPNFDTFRQPRVISASIMNARVLVLNASFEPINVCTDRPAVVMIFKAVAPMHEHNGHVLHAEGLAL